MSNQDEDNVFDAFHRNKGKGTNSVQTSHKDAVTDSTQEEQSAKVVVTLPGEQAVNGQSDQTTGVKQTESVRDQEESGQGAANKFINNQQGISPEAERFLDQKGSQDDKFLDFLDFYEVNTGDPAPVILDQAFFHMVKDVSVADDNAITINFFNGTQFIAVPKNWLTNSITIEKLVEVGVRYCYVPDQNMPIRLKNVLVHNGGNMSPYSNNKYFWLPTK